MEHSTSSRTEKPIAPSIFNLDAPEWYFNRELTWLAFNKRVLHEGQDERVPLLERVFFLAVVGSNLDEFFMKRIKVPVSEDMPRFLTLGDAGHYITLEDLMQRNLESRVEICTPVERPKLKKLLREMLDHQLNNHRNVWDLQADGSYRQRFAKVRDGSICIHRKLIEWAGKRLAAGGRGGVKKYRKVCSQYPCAHEERGRFLFRRFDFGDKKLHGCRRSFSGSRYGFHRKRIR